MCNSAVDQLRDGDHHREPQVRLVVHRRGWGRAGRRRGRRRRLAGLEAALLDREEGPCCGVGNTCALVEPCLPTAAPGERDVVAFDVEAVACGLAVWAGAGVRAEPLSRAVVCQRHAGTLTCNRLLCQSVSQSVSKWAAQLQSVHYPPVLFGQQKRKLDAAVAPLTVDGRSGLEPDLALVVLQRVADAPALGIAVRTDVVSAAEVLGHVRPVAVVVPSDARLVPRHVVARVHAWVAIDLRGCVGAEPAQRRRGWWLCRCRCCERGDQRCCREHRCRWRKN